MSPEIVPFIFNWRNQFEKARRTEDQLKEISRNVIVINSDDHRTCDDWIDVGDECYFTGQFLKALELFDGEIMFHVQADASYDDWQGVFDHAIDYFRKYHWGVFAPNVNFTGWNSTQVDIESQHLREPHLKLVSCTDCTCWFIHRDVVRQFIERKSLFAQNRFGWGIDLTMAALSYFNRRPVIRDYSHTIVHPRGRTYDNDKAKEEYQSFVRNIDLDLKPILDQLLQQRQELSKLFAPAG